MPKKETIQNLVAETKPDIKKETDEGIWNLASQNARQNKVQELALKGRKKMRTELLPFCEACLIADFNLATEDLATNRYGKDKRISLPKLSMEAYFGPELFDKVQEHVTRSRDGIRLEIVKSTQWKCKNRGHYVEIAEEPRYEHL